MMPKKIRNLQGIRTLDKNEQQEIYGTGPITDGCTGSEEDCCVTTTTGFKFCDAGKCINGKYCLWY